MTCYFFGCWGQPGHYLVGPGGSYVPSISKVTSYGDHIHIDGSLAPRMKDGRVTWVGSGATPRDRELITSYSAELPQGQFMLHWLDNGFTAIQWWDRQQGDMRGACNSTVLLEGIHNVETMLAAARQHFPSVLENLKKAGIELVEVKL